MANEEKNNNPSFTDETDKDYDVLMQKADNFTYEVDDGYSYKNSEAYEDVNAVNEAFGEEFAEDGPLPDKIADNKKSASVKSAKSRTVRKKGYVISQARVKVALALFLAVTALVLFLMSPVFSVKTVKVKGNSSIKTEKITEACGIKKGDNIFSVDITGAKENIESIARVSSVSITRDLPSVINIDVNEETECGYIKVKKNYAGIDSDGKVLVLSPKLEFEVPVINGMQVSDASQGQVIVSDAEDGAKKSELLSRILHEAKNQDIIKDIKSIDLSNIKDIKMLMRTEILVNLGEDGKEADNKIEYKIAYLKAIIPRMGSQRGGVIELADTNNVTSRAAEVETAEKTVEKTTEEKNDDEKKQDEEKEDE